MRTAQWLAFTALIAAARPAAADSPSDAKASKVDNQQTDNAGKTTGPEAQTGSPNYEHFRQFGVRVGLSGGYRMLFRYARSPYCVHPNLAKAPKDQEKFCGHAAPLAIDLALSFAPASSIEPFIWARFGLSSESQTDTKPLVLIGAGARLYTMSDSAFKVFLEPAFGLELEGGQGSPAYAVINPSYKTDLLFHLAGGPQLDLAQYFGLYLDAGLTVGVLRGIDSTLELTGGVQGRFP